MQRLIIQILSVLLIMVSCVPSVHEGANMDAGKQEIEKLAKHSRPTASRRRAARVQSSLL